MGSSNLVFNTDITGNEVALAQKSVYRSVLSDNASPFFRADSWLTECSSVYDTIINSGEFVIKGATVNNNREEVTIFYGGVYILLDFIIANNSLNAKVVSTQPLKRVVTTEILGKFRTLFPPLKQKAPDVIPMYFASWSRDRVNTVRRDISIKFWDSIQDNYAPAISEKLTKLMTTFHPSQGGQLILWHGNPGTGKTFAIRALTEKWSKWCDFYYVLDPEVFFGHAPYMIDLMTVEGYDDDYLPPSLQQKANERWKLFILEDAGELISDEARDVTGQGLSRLLNIVDGLIGQGLRVLLLITTNEPISNLHPAVARSGRCASEVHFKLLSYDDAKNWLATNDIDMGTLLEKKDYSLADLYGIMNGYEKIQLNKVKPKSRMGF